MASVRIGRYENNAGADFAVVGVNEQLASHTINHSSVTHTLTDMGARVGIYSGNPIVRLVLFWEHSDGRPGGVAGYTQEFTPDTPYTSGGGGRMHTKNLTKPLVVPAGHKLRVGITCRNGQAGIAMIPSADISEPNELFYRKNISGNDPVDAVGSAASTNGQLAIYADGETGATGGGGTGAPGNSIPFAPDILSSGSLTAGDLSPSLQLRHKDPDGNSSSKVAIQVRQKGQTSLKWDYEASVTVNNNAIISRTYGGSAISFSTTYEWRAKTWDSDGNEGPFSGWEEFRVMQANVAPDPPLVVAPRGNTIGHGLRPVLTIQHRDDDEDRATKARMKVRKKGQTALKLNVEWPVSHAVGADISRTYDGAELTYYEEYEFQGQTFDGTAWGLPSSWVTFTLFHTNRRPDPPIVQPPFPENFKTPADVRANGFTWVFSDPDALLPGMYTWEGTSTVRVIIREVGVGVTWDSGEITPAKKTHGQSVNLGYPSTAPALKYNTDYEVYYYQRDVRGAQSFSTKRTMRFNTGGSVSKPRLPVGRITNHANPGTVYATYTESNGLAANGIQVRVVAFSNDPDIVANNTYKQLAYSQMVPTNVASGSEVGLSWSHVGYSIPHGVTVGVEMRARIASNNENTDWSEPSWITGNAPPDEPRPISPENGYPTATKPVFAVNIGDRDQTPSSLSGWIEFATDPSFSSGSIVATTALSRVAGSNNIGDTARFEYDSSGVAFVLDTEYWWRAYSFDGYLYSGGSTSAGSAHRSTPRSFIYANVPVVTITSPAAIQTMSPTFSWTSSQQQTAYQVKLTNADGVVVYDTGKVSDTLSQHRVEDANWVVGEGWGNGETLSLTVSVWSVIEGTSAPLDITLNYTLPTTPTHVEANAVTPSGHVGTTMVVLTHGISEYTDEEFYAYRYYRTPISGPEGADVGPRRLLATNTGMVDTRFEDWDVESGQWYRWEVSQVTLSGLDEIESLTMSAEAMAQWAGVVLSLPYRPDVYNIHLRVGAPGRMYEVKTSRRKARTSISGGGLRRRVSSIGRQVEVDASGTFSLRSDRAAGVTGMDQRKRLHSLMTCADGSNSPDGRPHIVCFREGRGGPDSVIYGTFADNSDIVADGNNRDLWVADINFEDADFILGEAI